MKCEKLTASEILHVLYVGNIARAQAVYTEQFHQTFLHFIAIAYVEIESDINQKTL